MRRRLLRTRAIVTITVVTSLFFAVGLPFAPSGSSAQAEAEVETVPLADDVEAIPDDTGTDAADMLADVQDAAATRADGEYFDQGEGRFRSAVEAPFEFEMVGFTAETKPELPDAGRVRASIDGETWTAWEVVSFDQEDEPDVSSAEADDARAGSQPIFTDSARWVEFESIGDPSELGISFVDIDNDNESFWTGFKRQLREAPIPDAAPAGAAGQPRIQTRAEWGARSVGPPAYGEVRMAIVHHTVGSNDYTAAQSAGIVRGIQAFHIDGRGWSDIGYNLLIDRYGRTFEGRKGGMDKSPIGAQAGGFNTYSTGVALMGTFTSASPPAAMRNALSTLLAWKLQVHGVSPTGKTAITSGGSTKYPAGTVVTLNNVSGHRDVSATTCPGDGTYSRLGEIRSTVAGLYPGPFVPVRQTTAIGAFGDMEVFDLQPSGNGLRNLRFDASTGKWSARTLDRNENRWTGQVPIYAWKHLLVFGGRQGETELARLTFTPATGWKSSTVDKGGSGGRGPSALKWGGQVHVFNRPASGTGVRHVWWDSLNGAPNAETLDAGASAGFDSATVSYGGQLHVFNSTANGAGVRHQWWDSRAGRWFAETLDSAGSDGSMTTAVKWGGQLHLINGKLKNGGIRHLWWDPNLGRWMHESLDTGGDAAYGSTITDFGGQFHVYEATRAGANGLRHQWWDPRFGWSAETLDPSSLGHAPQAIDKFGQLHLFDKSMNGTKLRHLWWDSSVGAWAQETL